VFVLQGLNSFGQTNAAPSTARALARPEPQKQIAAPNATVNAAVVPPQNTLSHTSEAEPANTALFRRISEERLLVRERPMKDTSWARTESIFRSDNDQMGDSCIRDTYVIIFPTGR